jgi:alanyl-tRNA synthetase
MLGALRLDKTLWLRRSRSLGGTGCYRPAFESLSHGSRSFHHKTRPAPQSCTVLENFRAATAFSTTNSSLLHSNYSALIGLHLQILSASRNGYRFYSRSSTPPTMAEVKWTGPLVRKTFLDYFAERGHSIGKAPPSPPPPPLHPALHASVCMHGGSAEKHRMDGMSLAFRPEADIHISVGFIWTSLTSLPRSAIVLGRPSQ